MIYTVTVCLAMVLLLLDGSSSLMAFGATRVEVSMKKIKSRNTRSDMDEELKLTPILFLVLIAIALRFYAGSLRTSINSVVLASSRLTTFWIFATVMV